MLKTVWNTLYSLIRVQVSTVVAQGIKDGTADGINSAFAEIEASVPSLPAPAVVVLEAAEPARRPAKKAAKKKAK